MTQSRLKRNRRKIRPFKLQISIDESNRDKDGPQNACRRITQCVRLKGGQSDFALEVIVNQKLAENLQLPQVGSLINFEIYVPLFLVIYPDTEKGVVLLTKFRVNGLLQLTSECEIFLSCFAVHVILMVQAMKIMEKDEPSSGESKLHSIPCQKSWFVKKETAIAQVRLRI